MTKLSMFNWYQKKLKQDRKNDGNPDLQSTGVGFTNAGPSQYNPEFDGNMNNPPFFSVTLTSLFD